MLSKSELALIKVGDRIKFSAPTRGGKPTAIRFVKGFRPTFDESGCPTPDVRGEPLVRFHGYGDFIVRWHEIEAHYPGHIVD